MGDNLRSISKLNGSNFGIWKIRMKALLIHNDLWDEVKQRNTVDAPDPSSGNSQDPVVPSSTGDDEPLVSAGATEQTNEKSRKALSLIILSIEDNQMIHIEMCNNGREAWQVLHNLYEKPSTANKMRLYEEFLTMKLDKMNAVRDHIERFSTVRSQLRSVGVNIEDGLYKLALLRSLSEKYENLVITLENQIDNINVEDLHARIYREEVRKTSQESSNSYALSAWQRPKQYTGRKSKHVRCFYCNKQDHIKSNCFKRKQDEEMKKKNITSDFHAPHVFMANEISEESSMWYMDSGASFHICRDIKMFTTISTEEKPVTIELGNGDRLKASGKGVINLKFISIFGHYNVQLENVLYVPEASVNLLSVLQIQAQGFSVTFENDECLVRKISNDSIAMKFRRTGNGYKITASQDCTEGFALHVAEDFASNNKMHLWHKRFGHPSPEIFCEIGKNDEIADAPSADFNRSMLQNCNGCDLGKMTNHPYKAIGSRSHQILELVHTDLCGPMKKPSLSGARYFMIFVDDFSRKTFVYFLRHKSDAQSTIKEFIVHVERQTGQKVKMIKSDNGGEYKSRSLANYLLGHGISHNFAVPYTPQQNGTAERTNRIVIEKARCMLLDAGMPSWFWADAVSTAVYQRNITPSTTIKMKTPNGVFFNRKVYVGHLKVFGCKAQVYVPGKIRQKWDPTSKSCVFIGYTSSHRNYRFYDKEGKKVIVASRAKFYENERGWELNGSKGEYKQDIFDILRYDELSDPELFESDERETTNPPQALNQTIHQSHSDVHIPPILTEQSIEAAQSSEAHEQPQLSQQVEDSPAQPRRSTRRREPPLRLTYQVAHSDDDEDVARMYLATDPVTYEDAMRDENSAEWEEAMNKEINALLRNETWVLVPRPEDQKVIKNRWVYQFKEPTTERSSTYKARLVAKGCSQTYGQDYFETYAPVARLSTLRLMLAMAVQRKAFIHQMDVDNAFINGNLDELVYMEQPIGFTDTHQPDLVCKLNKTLYGLKQAANRWYELISHVLKDIGMVQTKSDQGLFHGFIHDAHIWIILYVDDVLLITNDVAGLSHVKSQLQRKFRMKDMGNAEKFLGIHLRYDIGNGILQISQADKILRMLQRFNMLECKPVSTPLDKTTISFSEPGSPLNGDVPYREAVGCFMYLSACSRPDISYATTLLSRYCDKATTSHWNLVKRVFRYLKGTHGYQLVYKCCNSQCLDIYTDADWAGLADRKSISGNAIFYGNCLVDWNVKQQSVVALSTTESEIIAMVEGYKSLKHMKKILEELNHNNITVTLYCDNQPSIAICKQQGYSGRAKHIELRHLAIQDYYARGEFTIKYCPSSSMRADIFTKPLLKQIHNEHVQLLQMSTSQ